MDLDFATVKTLSKVESPVYRTLNHKQHHELVAEAALNDMDNKTAISAAIKVLSDNGLSFQINPRRPDRPKVEGKEMDWATLLSLVDVIRERSWAVEKANDALRNAVLRWKEAQGMLSATAKSDAIYRAECALLRVRRSDLDAVRRVKDRLRVAKEQTATRAKEKVVARTKGVANDCAYKLNQAEAQLKAAVSRVKAILSK